MSAGQPVVGSGADNPVEGNPATDNPVERNPVEDNLEVGNPEVGNPEVGNLVEDVLVGGTRRGSQLEVDNRLPRIYYHQMAGCNMVVVLL